MNKELQRIYKADQKDRENSFLRNDFAVLKKRDLLRKTILDKLSRSSQIRTATDYYYAAFLYHHNLSLESSKKAICFAKKSIELGNKKARYLYALAMDRLLIKEGKRQKFGTQYKVIDGVKKLYPIDSKTTDAERSMYDVPPLEEIKRGVLRISKPPFQLLKLIGTSDGAEFSSSAANQH